MKLFAITLLAVCLIQGNHAQSRNGQRRRLTDVTNSVTSNAVAGNAANAAQDSAFNALNVANRIRGNRVNGQTRSRQNGVVSSAANAVGDSVNNVRNVAGNIQSSLSGGAQNLIDSATKNLSVKQLQEAASKLSANELLQAVTGAKAEVDAQVATVQKTLQDTVSSASAQTKAIVANRTKSWNSSVKKALATAIAKGINTKKCAVNAVLKLVKSTAKSAVKCVTDKVREIITLGKNIVKLPIRAAKIASKCIKGYKNCSSYTNAYLKKACKATVLVPAAVNSAVLVKDTVTYTNQATTLVSTLKTQMSACAAKVVAKNAAEAALLGGKIVTCIRAKVSDGKSAN